MPNESHDVIRGTHLGAAHDVPRERARVMPEHPDTLIWVAGVKPALAE